MTTKEEMECRLAGAVIHKQLEMVDAMIANDIPIDKIAVVSGLSLDEIQERRALLKRGL